ncbi:MAG: chemotaxis protein CheB, partial [Vicinamibacterales bacterium]
MPKASARTQRSENLTFPVVGIGASAGGLDAFKKLFSAMPGDSGMAFVLIPHLDPTHESLMVQLLAKQTTMPVIEAQDGMRVEANHVYIIPPNADLTIEHRVLHVAPPPPRRGSQTAIDVFLRSLAADQQAHAIGIILSGTGSHGSLGIQDIKAAGGMVLAQAPESAEHDQMPRGAMATGVVDHVLPPEQMPGALVHHAEQLSSPSASPAQEDLGHILSLVRVKTKRDFRGYRTNMLMRRVKRRMGLCHVDRIADYAEYLRVHPGEVQALGKDLSIGVTAFFREPDAFQVLDRVVIPELVRQHGQAADGERPVRVWVPGCATGEEAYSIAMLFLEQFAMARQPVNLQIFATDIDDEALEVARAGLYPESIAADVPAERLQRFFIKTSDHRYQVGKPLREVITFAPQSLTSDAPFSKLDLISCRNVLIYLEPDVQAKIVALFHFALLEGGYLMLGPAESIGPATDRFESVSKKWRVYHRIGADRRDLVEIPILPAAAPRARVG